jgi:hypothetical protein
MMTLLELSLSHPAAHQAGRSWTPQPLNSSITQTLLANSDNFQFAAIFRFQRPKVRGPPLHIVFCILYPEGNRELHLDRIPSRVRQAGNLAG